MRPTRFGVKGFAFLLLLFAAFFVSPYSNLFFLQIAFFCVFLAASMFWCAMNLRRVGGRVLEPRPFAADSDGATLESELRVTGRVARSVRIELQLENGNRIELLDAFDVSPTSTARVEGALPAMARGLYRIRAARAWSAYPFGLFRSARTLLAPSALAVFPRPVDVPGVRGCGLAATVAALSDGPLVPGEDVVGSLREWRDGDSVRHVHWRATARRGRPIVKDRDDSSATGLAIVFDRRGESDVIEHALAELTTLTIAARERAEPIELLSQGIHERFGEGARPIDELLRWLAGAMPLDQSAPAPPSAPAGAFRLPRLRRTALPVAETTAMGVAR